MEQESQRLLKILDVSVAAIAKGVDLSARSLNQELADPSSLEAGADVDGGGPNAQEVRHRMLI